MNKSLLISLSSLGMMLLLTSSVLQAQNVGIGTNNPHPKALVHLEDSTRGLLPTRMTTAQRDTLTNKPEGLVIYNVTTHCLEFWNGSNWISTCASTTPCTKPPKPVPTPKDTVYWCLGQNGQLCVNNITGLTYIWTGPNGFYATGACVTVPNVNNSSFGTYTVYAYNATTNCSSEDTVVVALQKTTPYFSCTSSNTWTALPTPPTTIPMRGDHVVAAWNDKIYFGLGENGSVLGDWWEYDICSANWQKKADVPIALGGSAFTFNLGGYIYVGGGGYPSTHYSQVYRYDPNNNTWTAVANLPRARRGVSGTSDGTYGYILGGEFSSGTYTDTIWRYDPTTNSWSFLTRIPGGSRGWAFLVYASGKLYAGTGNTSTGCTNLNDFYAYDLVTNSWNTLPNFPQLSNDGWASFNPINNRIYVTSGWITSSCTATNQYYYYDIASNTWNTIAIFPPGVRNNIQMVYNNGIFYAGFGEAPYVRDWWAYCP